MPVLQQSQFAVRGGGLPAVGCLYYSRANLPRRYLLDACTTAEPIKSDELQLGAMAALASLVVLGFRSYTYIYTYTYVHTEHMQTYTHTHIHTYTHTRTCTCIREHMYSQVRKEASVDGFYAQL